MIPGIVAAQAIRLAGDVGPAGALAHANFVTGVYAIDGAAVAASDIIDGVEFIDAGSEPGLFIDDTLTANGIVNLIGDFLTKLLTQDWTCALEYYQPDHNFTGHLFNMSDGATWDHTLQVQRLNSSELFDPYMYDTSPSNTRVAWDSGSNALTKLAIHRLAFNRSNDDGVAISADGQAVTEDTAPNQTDLATTHAAFGALPFDSGPASQIYIRIFTVYTRMGIAALPGLSSL